MQVLVVTPRALRVIESARVEANVLPVSSCMHLRPLRRIGAHGEAVATRGRAAALTMQVLVVTPRASRIDASARVDAIVRSYDPSLHACS